MHCGTVVRMSASPRQVPRIRITAVAVLSFLTLLPGTAHAVELFARADVLKVADVRVTMSAEDTAGLGVLAVDGEAAGAKQLVPSSVVTFTAVPLAPGTHRLVLLLRTPGGITRSAPMTVRSWGIPAMPACAVPRNGLQRKTVTLTTSVGGSTSKFTVLLNGRAILTKAISVPGRVPVTLALASGYNTVELRAENRMARTSKTFKLFRPVWPLPGYHTLSSPFGMRWGRMHEGIDIPAPVGTTVVAGGPGVVASAGSSGDYGLLVTIDHGGGDVTYYGHLSHIDVRVGQKVTAGQRIGRVGATGNATGPHLHFQVDVRGSAVNPLNYL